jgi:hypothetical protein
MVIVGGAMEVKWEVVQADYSCLRFTAPAAGNFSPDSNQSENS